MRPLGSGKKLAERRLRAVLAIEAGEWTTKEAAHKCKVSIRSIYEWLRRYREGGKAAIVQKKQPGRPSQLSSKDLEKLCRLLLKGAKKAGFDSDLWTCSRVGKVIYKNWGITYHPDHVWKILTAKLGWTAQKPARQAIERDEERVQAWKKYQWREIKKSQEGKINHSFC